MDSYKLTTWISENKIEDIKSHALTLSEKDYDVFIDELMQGLVTTADNGCRNTIAIVLGDLHCDKAIEPLIELIHNPAMRNCRGTLIYALENFDIPDSLDSFADLLVLGNYEVKCNVYTLFEKQIASMREDEKSIYMNMLKERIASTEEGLALLYALCATTAHDKLKVGHSKIIYDNFEAIDNSFLGRLHECDEFNQNKLTALCNAIKGASVSCKDHGEAAQQINFIYGQTLQHILYHFDPADGSCIKNLPSNYMEILEELETAVDIFFNRLHQ